MPMTLRIYIYVPVTLRIYIYIERERESVCETTRAALHSRQVAMEFSPL